MASKKIDFLWTEHPESIVGSEDVLHELGLKSVLPRTGNRFLCAYVNGELTGVTKLYANANDNDGLSIEYLHVGCEFQHHGIAKAMVHEIFDCAKREKRTYLFTEGFSEQGKSHLLEVFQREQSRHPDVSFQSYSSC